jgi:hypothetical protein
MNLPVSLKIYASLVKDRFLGKVFGRPYMIYRKGWFPGRPWIVIEDNTIIDAFETHEEALAVKLLRQLSHKPT